MVPAPTTARSEAFLMSNDNVRNLKTRAIVLRATDQSFLDLLTFIKGYPDCIFVYSKSSDNKIVLKEEAF
jgi:hypothetical protein